MSSVIQHILQAALLLTTRGFSESQHFCFRENLVWKIDWYQCRIQIFDIAFTLNIPTVYMTNSVDPDQTAPKEQSDQGLHCLSIVLYDIVGEKIQLKFKDGTVHYRNG